ncbi:MAG: Hsp20/alpha crystallin family protein, partial [Acidobacteriota bacterium]
MSSRRWKQMRELIEIQQQMNRLFEDVIERPRSVEEEETIAGAWMPAVDIYETEQEFILKAELPEVRQQHIQINVENDKLVIRGERHLPYDLKREQFHRIERAYGQF